MSDEHTPSAGSAAILCTGGLDAIRKEAWSTEQFPVSAYVGSSVNMKDLKKRTPGRRHPLGGRDKDLILYKISLN